MLKTKKSKLLATMLCATVVAGLYAGPVMADTVSGLTVAGSTITAGDTVTINGVTLAGDGITAANDKFKVYSDGGLRIGPGGSGNAYFTINGQTGLVSAKTFEADHITAGSISAGNKNFGVDQWGNVYIGENAGNFSSGSGVNAAIKLSTDGTIAAKSITAEGLTLGEKTLTEDNIGKVNGLFGTRDENRPVIYAGNGSIVGGVQFNAGEITADSLTLGKMNVGTAITDLQKTVGSVGTNTAGITNDKGVTVIDQGLKVKGEDGREVFSVARDGAINAVVTDGLGGTSANFVLNGENVELKYGNNGITANINGTTISGNGTDVVVNENGATFTKANSTTVINGGAITAETLNGANIDKLISDVGETNANVAGIKREGNEVSGYKTTIEGTTKFDENGMTTGTINAANGSFQVEEGNGKTVVAGSMIYSKNQNGSYGILDGNQLLLQGTDGSKVSIINGNIETSGNILANGSMTAEDFITKDGVKLSEVNDNLKNLGDAVDKTNANVAGITREEINGDYVTTIEGAIRISESGYISLNGDNLNFTYQTKDGIGIGNLGALANKVTEIDNRLDVVEDKTQNINSDATHGGNGQTGEGGAVVDNGANTGFDGDVTVGGDVNANGGSFTGDVQVGGSLTVGGENGTAIDSNGMTVGDTSVDKDGVTVGGENGTSITKDDVVINKGTDNEVSLSDVGGRVDNLEQGLASANNRIDHLEDRIDKVGAMSAAIANLRTMGYDPTAPTEIAVGIGQYRDETGAALGLFHYPNKDFMLSLSVSTSGDEVMGGIGATWKFGRKTPEQMLEHEKEKAAKAKLAKAEAMKKAAAEAKVAAQQAKHAQMAAERAAK